MPTLFPHLAHHADETPLSFAARLAALHTGGRLVPFLNDIGVNPVRLATGDRASIERLAAASGVDPERLLRNAAVSVAKRRYDLRGHAVTAEFLSSPDTVFCPDCLQEDDERASKPGGRRGRFVWTLRAVRTCPVHHVPLVKRRRERWDDQFHELDRRVPERGGRLETLIRGLKMRTPSPLQDYVLARLAGQTGPSWLDGQTLEQAVRTTELLGVLLAFGPKLDLNRLPEADWDHAGAVGYRFTSRGESGIREALGLAQAAFEGKGKPGRRKVFGHLYEWLLSKRTTQDPGEIKRIFREHIFETMEVATGEIILGEPLDKRRLHSVESLAKAQGLDARTLRNVLIARNLIPSTASVEGYHLFDAALGEEVAASVKRGIHVISMPDALNCTRPQFDQLVHERILTPISRGGHVARGRTHKAFDGEHVAEFLRRLRERAEPAAAKPTGFVPIAKAAEKAKVPCIDIVHLILGGFLENVVRLAGNEGYSAVLVDAVEVKKVTKSVMIGMSAADAFEALAVPPPPAGPWSIARTNFD
jgi:hypothetical protein